MWIESSQSPKLDELQAELAKHAISLDEDVDWPTQQWRLCADYGVFRWFIPEQYGGAAWTDADIVRGYLKLSAGCLTTTFILTQYTGAARRIAASDNEPLKEELLPRLAAGETFSTVGISHLTTSRRHLKKNILRAQETPDGFELDGFAPWVTGSTQADSVVVGATFDDGRQLLIAVPTDLEGVSVPRAANLIGLNASQTGPVEFSRTVVPSHYVLAGPIEEVMKQGAGARTGGVQTSTLAVGLANAAIQFLLDESTARPELAPATTALSVEAADLEGDLIKTASGEHVCSNEELRTRANSLALRSAQSALAAAKGAGYVKGHPAGRWCREALFFLVWSCPQPVLAANLCELAGLAD